MLKLRTAVETSTDLACQVLGRRNVVRCARLVLRRASRDIRNDMRVNGETSLQEWVLALWQPGCRLPILDVGANHGRWSAEMLSAARRVGRGGDLDLHSFEPSSWTFARLEEALAAETQVTLRQVAMSETSGTSVLHVVGDGAGTNSLHDSLGQRAVIATEPVAMTTLDEYANEAQLAEIALVKVDTEGHDLAVLRGARHLLADHRVSVVQFEYNWRWVESRCFLSDAFGLFNSAGYLLGKLTPDGIEFYPSWDPDLETFVEGNYVAAVPDVAARLPAVRWWKAAPATGRGKS
ncbi:MAG: FkbM family methyltransferase [Streptosporangiaceae bacterium]